MLTTLPSLPITPAQKERWIRQFLSDRGLPSGAAKALMAISLYLNTKTGCAFPSIGTIAGVIGMSRDTVMDGVDLAEERGHLKIKRGRGRHRSNRYYITLISGAQPTNSGPAMDGVPPPLAGSDTPRSIVDSSRSMVEPTPAKAEHIPLEPSIETKRKTVTRSDGQAGKKKEGLQEHQVAADQETISSEAKAWFMQHCVDLTDVAVTWDNAERLIRDSFDALGKITKGKQTSCPRDIRRLDQWRQNGWRAISCTSYVQGKLVEKAMQGESISSMRYFERYLTGVHKGLNTTVATKTTP